MNNYFFFENKINFFDIWYRRHKKYLLSDNPEIKNNNKKLTLIDEDIFDYQDWADINKKSLIIADDLRKKDLVKNNILQSDKYKNIAIQVSQYLHVDDILKKIKNNYKISDIFVCGVFKNYKLNKYLKKKKRLYVKCHPSEILPKLLLIIYMNIYLNIYMEIN